MRVEKRSVPGGWKWGACLSDLQGRSFLWSHGMWGHAPSLQTVVLQFNEVLAEAAALDVECMSEVSWPGLLQAVQCAAASAGA